MDLRPGMYLAHYGLNEPPFSITPDPRFVFLSERHRDALAHLLFGIGQGGGGGFVQLTGEVGTGKTTLCRVLLEQLPDNARVALVLNPQLSPIELLETICEEFSLDLTGCHGSRKLLVDLLNRFLLKAYALDLSVVLIIDEAQNLSIEALEQVRLLTNLETPTQKLLQIILLGQPELRTMLARDDLRQLAQRITARYHLMPMDAGETAEYLRHRYRVAGGQRFPFTSKAITRLHRHAGGVPRLINVIAERTLLAGYAHDESTLGEGWVERASREALSPTHWRWRWRWPATPTVIAVAVTVAALAAVTVMAVVLTQPPASAPMATAAAASSAPAGPARGDTVANVTSRPPTPQLDGEAVALRLRRSDPTSRATRLRLLALWGVPASDAHVAATTSCVAPVAMGVYCLRGLAHLEKLATQARPALLRLRTEGGDAWAMLLGADAVHVRLQLDDEVFDTDRIALEQLWTGEYLALWRPPAVLLPLLAGPTSSTALGTGATGPEVQWVRGRLQPRYIPAGDGPARFDERMRDAVRRYQRARWLVGDGVVGPETLMALASDEHGPRLLRVLE